MHLCTDADEQWQSYNESTKDCGEGKTCIEPLECVVSPLQPCERSTCKGDVRMVCGKSGNLAAIEDCAKNGRICRASSSDVACVWPDAPCPEDKSSFCSKDQAIRYTGCEKGFGYAIEATPCADCGDSECRPLAAFSGNRICRESSSGAACALSEARCPDGKNSFCSADRSKFYTGCQYGFGYPLDTKSCSGAPCGTPVCVDGEKAASCGDSPPVLCGSQQFICSADGQRSLRCLGDVHYACWEDCAKRGKTCVPSTGECSQQV